MSQLVDQSRRQLLKTSLVGGGLAATGGMLSFGA